jgi:predicted nucleotidyltransferase
MNSMDLNKIKDVLSRELPKYPVAFAYVFGSAATGHADTESDLDIALGFSGPVPEDIFYKIFNILAGGFGVAAEKLDLKNFAELPLAVRFRVIRDGLLVYVKDQKKHREAAVRTLDFYHDNYPVMKKFNRLFFKHAAATAAKSL